MLTAKYESPRKKDPLIFIVISVIVGSILTIYPITYDVAAWRPCVMMLITLFWVMCQPSWCGVWFAFAMGIFTDLLTDAPLGQSALAYVLITFTARYFVREKRVLTFLNLWLIALIAIVVYLLFIWVTQVMFGVSYPVMRRWPPFVSSLMVWPIIYYCLKKWRV